MGRRERPLAAGPLQEFASDLRRLRESTGLTYRALARVAQYAPSALSAAASGDSLPTASVLEAYVRACGGDTVSWEERRKRLAGELARTSRGLPSGDAEPVQDIADRHDPRRDTRKRRSAAYRVQFGLAPLLLAGAIIISYAIIRDSGTTRTGTPTAARSSVSMNVPGAGGSAAGGHAETPFLLGAPNFGGYCQHTRQGDVALLAAYHAYGWHCVADNGKGDDAEAVCAWTFHLPPSQVTNTVQDFNDPYTWQCWRVTRELSAPDWTGYCQYNGHGAAQLTGNDASDAYGWRCSDGTAVSATAACEWTNHTTPLVSRFQDFWDPETWQCWG